MTMFHSVLHSFTRSCQSKCQWNTVSTPAHTTTVVQNLQQGHDSKIKCTVIVDKMTLM